MNEIVKQGLLALATIPLAYLLLRLIFRGSIMFKFSFYTVVLSIFVGFTSYFKFELEGWHELLITLLNVTVGFFVFLRLNKLLRQPLDKAVYQANLLAHGDLHVEIEQIKAKNELGVLSNSLYYLKTQLTTIISNTNQSVLKFENLANQLKVTSEHITSGISEQASSLEEISSTMEEMASNIASNNTNSQRASQYAKETQKEVKVVHEAATKSLKAVSLIADQINMISEIAMQTNILSLNAAVEAANAGNYGKGFSVVATEVRKLADKSRQVANSISSEAENSLELTHFLGERFDDVVPKIQKSTESIHEISAASLQQNVGVEQMNETIQNLSHKAQGATMVADKMLLNSTEIEAEMQNLRETISYFKV
nr:methyl-accepting chemotaxis protein [uncultured Carboxylicivirga sp.]